MIVTGTRVIYIISRRHDLVYSTHTDTDWNNAYMQSAGSHDFAYRSKACCEATTSEFYKIFINCHGSWLLPIKMGFDFAGKAVYNVVWVGAVSLFMVLLGFLTQKWLTAVGLGTVLLTLAGREIFTNFLSSVIIHTTRPFVLNEWIQTKIEGYQVSGTNENVPPAGSTDQNRRDNNIDAYSVAAAKVGPCSMPGARVGAFGNQVILPLAHTIEHEEVINHTTFNL